MKPAPEAALAGLMLSVSQSLADPFRCPADSRPAGQAAEHNASP
jgi:hypothetical protein